MNKENKIFEDLTKLAGSAMDTAFNSINDMKSQFEQTIHAKIDEVLQKHNLVSREEFEVVKEMLEKSRLEQAKLEKKIATLEKKLKATK
jgi:BMFP domain-containing protein YqiC